MAKYGYFCTALTGGTNGCLDKIDGANLADQDIAFVAVSSNFYIFQVDADSGLPESSPDVIEPDSNAEDKRWILLQIYGASSVVNNLDWDNVWSDAVHSHSSDAEGGTLDWDNVWSDAVHTHQSDAEGGNEIAGGSDTQIQFNDNAVLSGANGFIWDKVNGWVGIGTVSPSALLELAGTIPYLIIHNSTHEDTDSGRKGQINFKGEQSGGEQSTLARIEAIHDGTADDEKGALIFYTNMGTDADVPTERIRINDIGTVILDALAHRGKTAGFYSAKPVVQATLSTGAGATVDDVITILQNLGLVKQAIIPPGGHTGEPMGMLLGITYSS